MIEIENLTKYCGLSAFRYWAFPAPGFDDVAAAQISDVPAAEIPAEAEPAPEPVAPQPPPPTRAPGPPRVEPRLEPATPATPIPRSVLGEVAAVLNPAASEPNPVPAPARSTRAGRAARSAWRAATSPPPPG